MKTPSNLISTLRYLLAIIGTAGLARGWFTGDEWAQWSSVILMVAPVIWSNWHNTQTKSHIEDLADTIEQMHQQLVEADQKHREQAETIEQMRKHLADAQPKENSEKQA